MKQSDAKTNKSKLQNDIVVGNYDESIGVSSLSIDQFLVSCICRGIYISYQASLYNNHLTVELASR